MIELAATLIFAAAPPVAEDEDPNAHRPEIEVGARLFMRPEARVNEDFSTGLPDDAWRIRQGARAHVHGFWGPLSAKVSLQHVYDWGGGSVTPSGATNRSGVFEGYIDVVGEREGLSGFLRVGRQWFALGSERLLAYRYWQPGNQSLDALRAEGTVGRFTLGGFGSLVAPPGSFTVVDDSDPPVESTVRTNGHLFGAAYLAVRAHRAIEIEAYAYGWNEGPLEAAPQRERRLATYQLRVLGEPLDGLVYSGEGNVQIGEVDGRDHEAWSFAGALDYELGREGVRPGFGAIYELYSGERCVNEPDDPTGCGARQSRDFNRLLGIGHRYRGHLDLVSASNTRTLTLRSWLRPDETVKISLDYNFFQLHQPDGKWTYNNGAPVGRGWDPDNEQRNLGHEIDFELAYRPWKVLSVRPSYGVFIPAAAARRIAGSAPQHFVFVWMVAELGKRW